MQINVIHQIKSKIKTPIVIIKIINNNKIIIKVELVTARPGSGPCGRGEHSGWGEHRGWGEHSGWGESGGGERCGHCEEHSDGEQRGGWFQVKVVDCVAGLIWQ